MELTAFWYAIYKLIKYAVFPMTWLAASVALLAILVWLPHSPTRLRLMRYAVLLTVAVVFGFGNPMISTTLLGSLEAHYPARDAASLGPADAIVVLGGGVVDPGSLRPAHELRFFSLQRVQCGADLYGKGLAPTLVVAGGDSSWYGPGSVESVWLKRHAMRLGVPEQAIRTEERSRTTYENAVEIKRLLGDRVSLILVTSAFHMLRAEGLFKKQGMTVEAFPCGYQTRSGPGLFKLSNPASLIPTVEALQKSTFALSEAMGIVVYWISGKW